MKTDERNPDDWFLFANERLASVDALWKQFGPSYSVVELLHEAVERFLKGYLVANGWSLERIHDLNRLVEAAMAFEPQFGGFAELAHSLTEQFWEQHYPGGDLTEVGSDYELLRQQAGEMIALIQASIVPPNSGDIERT
jgi:HEPN domain-containing protein